MNKFLMLTCGMLMVSSVALAEETTPETCANGAGTVVIGAVSGHKYCRSQTLALNWWNAWAWCDAQGKKLFGLDNCRCDATINCVNKCPELNLGNGTWTWTATPAGTDGAYTINTSAGTVGKADTRRFNGTTYAAYTICK